MKTLKLKSRYDELDLSVSIFEPTGIQPKGILQISHGMAEHKERYYPFMEFLAANGWISVIHDHRGHGESVKSPEDLGHMYSGGAEALVEDLKLVQDKVKSDYPGLKWVLFGHSMGSMVVRAFTRKYDDSICSLIVCGCPSDNPAKGVALFLAKAIGLFLGDRHCSKFINALAFGSYNKRFEGRTEYDWLSVNKENVDRYIADELCGVPFTCNAFYGLFSIIHEACKGSTIKAIPDKLPLLLVSGKDDPVGGYGKGVIKLYDKLSKYGKDVTMTLYEGYRHEILNDDCAPLVEDDIVEFIEANI